MAGVVDVPAEVAVGVAGEGDRVGDRVLAGDALDPAAILAISPERLGGDRRGRAEHVDRAPSACRFSTAAVGAGSSSPSAKRTGSPERAAQAAAGIAKAGSSSGAMTMCAGASREAVAQVGDRRRRAAGCRLSTRSSCAPSGAATSPIANNVAPPVRLAACGSSAPSASSVASGVRRGWRRGSAPAPAGHQHRGGDRRRPSRLRRPGSPQRAAARRRSRGRRRAPPRPRSRPHRRPRPGSCCRSRRPGSRALRWSARRGSAFFPLRPRAPIPSPGRRQGPASRRSSRSFGPPPLPATIGRGRDPIATTTRPPISSSAPGIRGHAARPTRRRRGAALGLGAALAGLLLGRLRSGTSGFLDPALPASPRAASASCGERRGLRPARVEGTSALIGRSPGHGANATRAPVEKRGRGPSRRLQCRPTG